MRPERWNARASSAALLLLIAIGADAFSNRAADPDFWGHLAIGRLIVETGAIPRADVFSYLPTRDWLNYEWLANLLQFAVHSSWGDGGIILLKTVLGLALLTILLRHDRARSDLVARLVIALPAVLLVGLGFAPRAQIFTYLLFGCWLCWLERARWDRRWLALLPITMVAWANLHAGFLAGLGLPLLYALGEAARRRPWKSFAAAFAVCCGATLINPYGLKYWTVLLEGITMRRPGVTEWESVPFDLASYPEFKALVLLAIVLMIWIRDTDAPASWLVLCVTGALAWKVQRHLPLFGIAAAVLLPRWLTMALERLHLPALPFPRTRGVVLTLLFTASAAAVGLRALVPADGRRADGRPGELRHWLHDPVTGERVAYPSGAVEFMRRERLRGKVAVEFNWGLYVVNALYPAVQVSVDGRNETVFAPAVIEACRQFFLGNDPAAFLSKYPPDFVLTDGTRLREFLTRDARAKLIYSDDHSWLYRIARSQ